MLAIMNNGLKGLAFRSVIILALSLNVHSLVMGQGGEVHPQSASYTWPDDPLVRSKLEKWRELKFGVIFHWGIYSVPGIVESWALCSEDWISRPDSMSYCEFKEWYWSLKNQFNPENFNPDSWAKAAKDAGMRYMVFTTKHHDGFCMFDTQETTFKITAGPFAGHKLADAAKHVFEAFRREGFMTGAYFSKPDWHCEYYWDPQYATPDRNNNYDIRKHPEKWDRFKQFTHAQIGELMRNYGGIDILWLDGGWVRPLETVNDEVRSWGAKIPEWSQDIDMPAIAEIARQAQPGLLIVERTVHGPYENYLTPERRIPENKIDYPWETCVPLGDNWGYVPDDRLKSSREIIHMLVEIVAKGGSMLLGIGPKPDGTIGAAELERMKEIGEWLRTNGAAIYGSSTMDKYQEGDIFFTKNKDGSVNAIVRLDENSILPEFSWSGLPPKKNTKMKLLADGAAIPWKQAGDRTIVPFPFR